MIEEVQKEPVPLTDEQVWGAAPPEHSDDKAVINFATAMRHKLKHSREVKGRSGWEDKTQLSQLELSAMLLKHISKGDPVDVANFCMMLHQRGESITPPEFNDWCITSTGATAESAQLEIVFNTAGDFEMAVQMPVLEAMQFGTKVAGRAAELLNMFVEQIMALKKEG